MSLSPYIYLSHYHITYLLAWSFAALNAVWTVDVHVDVGADIAGECSVIFLTSVVHKPEIHNVSQRRLRRTTAIHCMCAN